jgi:hypothetical protein
LSTKAFIKKSVFPRVFLNPQLEHINVNQRLFYSNKVLNHIETQQEKNYELEKAQEELFCEFTDLSLKTKRLMNDFCQHVAKQTSFTDWITKQVKEQASLYCELVDKHDAQSHEIKSIAENVSCLSSTQTNHTNQLNNQKQELEIVKGNVANLDQLQLKYSKQLSEYSDQTDLLKDKVIQQEKENENFVQEQENLHELLTTQQKQIDNHYQKLSDQFDEQNRSIKSQLDEHKEVHVELNQKLTNLDEINKDVEQQYNNLNGQLLDQNKINEKITASLLDQEQKMVHFLDRLTQQEALYQLLHSKLLDIDEQHNHLFHQLNEHETNISTLDHHILDHDHVHKNLHDELLYQVKRYEDMYNELHNNMKNTQYELSTSSNDNEKKYNELIQKLNEQVKINSELKKEIATKSYKGPFVELFKGLPSNYPVDTIYINGKNVDVTRFLNISSEGNIAHFTDEMQIKTFDCNKIDGVQWGKETLDTKPNDFN